MSFVLDALNKADREQRGVADQQEMSSADEFLSKYHAPIQKDRSAINLIVFIIVLVLLFSGFFAWVYTQRVHTEVIKEDSSLVENSSTINHEVLTPVGDQKIAQGYEVKAKSLPINPEYQITGHIFLGDRNSANKVFIDQKAYRISDILPNDFQLIEIANDYIVVERMAIKYTLHYYQ